MIKLTLLPLSAQTRLDVARLGHRVSLTALQHLSDKPLMHHVKLYKTYTIGDLSRTDTVVQTLYRPGLIESDTIMPSNLVPGSS